MIEKLISFALHKRLFIIGAALAVLVFGIYSLLKLNVEAFPDVTTTQVQISTEVSGLAAVEVEKLVTAPIESVMGGLPGVTQVRSISKAGLSAITVVFKDEVDVYFARQLVLERLQLAKERIPPGVGDPEIGPITTGLGQIYKYALVSSNRNSMELRTINDWIVKYQLRTVPGVTDVLSFGGEVKQYQVNVNPYKMRKYSVTFSDVLSKIEENNKNAGGWYIEGKEEQLVVRGEGTVRSGEVGLRDIEHIVIRTENGVPIYIKDVADVEFGSEIRQGAATKDGSGEVVMGIVLQLKGANAMRVIDDVRKAIPKIQKSLPPDVQLQPVYDQADLVEKAIETVRKALIESAFLIIIVLFLFLWDIRAACVVVSSIPISMMIAFIMMRFFGLSANLQSLAGLAIGIGMMVDGAVVVVENIVHKLSQPHKWKESRRQEIIHAAVEVGKPVFFGVLIIIVVFLPLFTLQGVEGKLFRPMAFTIAFAMLGSLILSLTVVPSLASLVLKVSDREKESPIMKLLTKIYVPTLQSFMSRKQIVFGAAIALLIGALCLLPFIGTEFVPELEEGSMAIRVTMPPSIALDEAKRISTILEKKLMKYPEVTYAFSQIGRPELGGDPEPIANNEIFVGLLSQKKWKTTKSKKKLIQIFEKDLSEYPGLNLNFSQPIATRVDELISGVKAQIAIKLFGEDLEVLTDKGKAIETIVKNIPGASDVQMEQIEGEAQMVVKANRDKLARYGLNVADVMNVVSKGIGGIAASEVIEGQKRFDIYVRLKKEFRSDKLSIGNLLVNHENGTQIPLAQVADINIVEGPPSISRENAQRRIVIQCNVRGRDMGGFVQEAQDKIQKKVSLPSGYVLVWGGQFENQQRAMTTLMVVVPVALLLIFFLLFLSFGSINNALIIMLNVPFSLVGGIAALFFSGHFLSVPASVGFITLFGVAILNGVVMVSHVNQRIREGEERISAIIAGSISRLRPVLMTALVASLGLIPILLSSGIGSEVQKPLATVVAGGLVTSTLLTLFVLPLVYSTFGKVPKQETNQED